MLRSFIVGRTWCFAAIVALGALLRLHGLDWDEGQHLHPDERFLTMVAAETTWPASVAEYFDTAHSPLNPARTGRGSFVYGTLPLFLVKGVATAIGRDSYAEVYLVGRVMAALFDIGTLLLTYRLAMQLAGPAVALGAAALVAFAVTSIQQAHFFTVDSFAACLATASLLAVLRVARGGGVRAHVVFGVLFAMTLACRANLLVLAAPYAAAALPAWRPGGVPLRDSLLRAGAAALVTAVVFRLLQPYAFEGPGIADVKLAPDFVGAMRAIRALGTGLVDYPPSVQWIGRTPILFPARNLLIWGIGPAWGVATLAALPWCLLRRGTAGARLDAAAVVLAWAPLLFFVHATQFAATVRYVLPIVPVLATAVAWWLLGSLHAQRTRRIAFAGILIATAFWAVAFTAVYRRPHTRVTASHWIYQHVAPGTTIATEYWDDPLPLPLGDRTRARYTMIEVRPYDEETEHKREHLIGALDSADLIVLSSNRLYESIPRTPWRYPLGRRYYELLFSGELGFTLDRAFTSWPGLGALEIDDDAAEEAFTVYDHPKVLIFRKTASYSHGRVRALLDAVPLGGLEKVAPRQAAALYRRDAPAPLALPGEARTIAAGVAHAGSVGALARWLAALEVVSLAIFALLFTPLAGATDRGYSLAKLLAWIAPASLVWWIAANGLGESSQVVARTIAALLVAGGVAAAAWNRHELTVFCRRNIRTLLAMEVLFLATFGIFTVVRAWNPAVFWGEKPMDFAILHALLRSPAMPPPDPWFAGAPLNYFYFGQTATAVSTMIAGVSPAFGFNLALPTLAALLAVAACAFGLQLTGRLRVGFFAALLVVLTGNLTGLRSVVRGWPTLDFGYFWSTSRVVPDTINEYPLWNLAFGDLHAHVLAMPVTAGLLYLGALWLPARQGRTTVHPWLVAGLSAWFVGTVAVTSAWSAPAVVALQLAFLLTAWLQAGAAAAGIGSVVALWCGIIIAARLLFLPFWATYAPVALQWNWVAPTAAPVDRVALVFGIFLTLAAPALGIAGWRWMRSRRAPWVPVAAAVVAIGTAAARSVSSAFFMAWLLLGGLVWVTDRRRAVRAGAGLVAAACGLGIVAETVFVWDRMNTVFKLYLDMWLMLGAAAALLATAARDDAASHHRDYLTGVFGAAVLAGLLTSVTAIGAFVRDPIARSAVPTLDGTNYLQVAGSPEREAYAWLNREIGGTPVILEAQGAPYGAFGRVSMNTGLPAVLGWEYHLFQQGRPRAELARRAVDVRTMYDGVDLARAEQLLRQYRVSLVFVGPLERATYSAEGIAKFGRSADYRLVFRNADVSIYATHGLAGAVHASIGAGVQRSATRSGGAPLRDQIPTRLPVSVEYSRQ